MRIIIVTDDAATEVIMDETYGLRDLEIAMVNRDHPGLPVLVIEPKVDAPKVKGAFKSLVKTTNTDGLDKYRHRIP